MRSSRATSICQSDNCACGIRTGTESSGRRRMVDSGTYRSRGGSLRRWRNIATCVAVACSVRKPALRSHGRLCRTGCALRLSGRTSRWESTSCVTRSVRTLAMRGAPARSIQELVGHADLTMTQRYMHLSPAALDAAVRLLDRPGSDQKFGDVGETGVRN